MLFIPISISMFLLAVKFCWLCVFYWCYLYSIFCIWVHPGILNPPLEFLGYSHNFCLVLVKKQLFLLCNCTLESAQPGSHFIQINYQCINKSFSVDLLIFLYELLYPHKARIMCKRFNFNFTEIISKNINCLHI